MTDERFQDNMRRDPIQNFNPSTNQRSSDRYDAEDRYDLLSLKVYNIPYPPQDGEGEAEVDWVAELKRYHSVECHGGEGSNEDGGLLDVHAKIPHPVWNSTILDPNHARSWLAAQTIPRRAHPEGENVKAERASFPIPDKAHRSPLAFFNSRSMTENRVKPFLHSTVGCLTQCHWEVSPRYTTTAR